MQSISDLKAKLDQATNNHNGFTMYMALPTRAMANETALVYEMAGTLAAKGLRCEMTFVIAALKVFKDLGLILENRRLEVLESIKVLNLI